MFKMEKKRKKSLPEFLLEAQRQDLVEYTWDVAQEHSCAHVWAAVAISKLPAAIKKRL